MSKQNNKSDLCICKICLCGRHHCPHQPMRTVASGPCALSEYTNQFIPRPITQVKSFKPLSNYAGNSEPLEDRTNHRIDFVPHALEKRYIHQREPYKPSEGEFAKNTTYTSEYNPKHGERAVMFKRAPEHKDLGKFEGTPTYRSDYPGWAASPREIYGKPADWAPPDEAFSGIPTYSLDYVKYQNTHPRESFRPTQQTQIPDVPFQDMTENRQSYIQHPVEARKIREQSEWSRPAVPFTGETTFTSDFKEKPISMNKSFKPSSVANLSSEPLQSSTTHTSDYRPWGVEKPFMHQHDKYVPPEGSMFTDTTYLRDYLPQKSDRVTAFRPKNLRENLDKFDAKTSYSYDFQKWSLGARQKYGPNREYVPSDTPFQTTTTHGSHYVPMPMSMRESFKQSSQTHLSNAPFKGESIYRTEFTPKEMDVCPTTIMGSPRAPYEYTGEMNEKGHLLVAPTRNGELSLTNEVAVY